MCVCWVALRSFWFLGCVIAWTPYTDALNFLCRVICAFAQTYGKQGFSKYTELSACWGWRSYYALILKSVCKEKCQHNMENYGEADSKPSSINHLLSGHSITVANATHHAAGVCDLITAFRIVVTSPCAFSSVVQPPNKPSLPEGWCFFQRLSKNTSP